MSSEFTRRGMAAFEQGLPREYTNDGDEGGSVALAKKEWYEGWDAAKKAATDAKAQAEHNEIWAPILSAWRVAAALRTQADAFLSLPDAAKDAWVPGLSKLPHPDEWAAHLRRQADAIELAAPLPITPTEEDYEALFEMYYDCLGEVSSKDHAREQMHNMTEADKAEAIAQMALDELTEG